MTLNLKKRWLFSRRRNVLKDSAFVSKLFQIRGPTTRKARLATVDSVTGVRGFGPKCSKVQNAFLLHRTEKLPHVPNFVKINQSINQSIIGP